MRHLLLASVSHVILTVMIFSSSPLMRLETSMEYTILIYIFN